MVRWRKPHLRVPGYIHGVIGTVERHCVGLAKDAAASAYREPAVTQPLYRVRFCQRHLWEASETTLKMICMCVCCWSASGIG